MRLVVPRAPEVAHEVGVELTEAQLLVVEEYLHHHGYIEPVDMGLSWGTYTITRAGFDWLEGGMPEPASSAKDPVLELAERPGEEAALEAALRAELEEEQRRMEEFQRELEEAGQRQEGPPRASGRAAEEPRGTAEEPHPPRGGFRTASERRWWEFWR